jgi:hypothetical protein
MSTILIVLDNWCVTLQRKGEGSPCTFFCYFCDSNFLCKTKYFEQSSCRIDNQTCWQINHTIMTWVFEGEDVIYFPSLEKGQYDVDISWLLKDLLYKDIPLTLYFKTENVMDSESVFIAWITMAWMLNISMHIQKGLCFGFFNLHEDLLYKDIRTKFHVNNTWDYFDTIWHLLIFNWIHK